MNKDIRIQQALDNWDSYVEQLATMPDKVLSDKLDVINMQAIIAHEKNIESSIELLDIWWKQIVEARIYKAENNIPDAPNEIEIAISDVETMIARTEQREEILNEPSLKRKAKVKEDNSNQTSLF